MTVINYPSNSPYSLTPQTSWYLERWVYKPVPPDSGDQPFTLLERHRYRPDTLSYDLYSTPAYWWVFSIRNPQLRAQPIWDFVPGLTIIVPSAAHVRKTAGA